MAGAGKFITFEGVEGAGKTTQIARARDLLISHGLSVVITREPGGDDVSESIRELVLTKSVSIRSELLLFLASRAQNVDLVIRPALAAGSYVICDRFIDSSIAYQGYGRGLGRDIVAELNRFATGNLVPDLTVLLDLDPKLGLARQTNHNRMEAESLEFHGRVREGFLAEAAKDTLRFCVLDAADCPEVIQAEIASRIATLIVPLAG